MSWLLIVFHFASPALIRPQFCCCFEDHGVQRNAYSNSVILSEVLLPFAFLHGKIQTKWSGAILLYQSSKNLQKRLMSINCCPSNVGQISTEWRLSADERDFICRSLSKKLIKRKGFFRFKQEEVFGRRFVQNQILRGRFEWRLTPACAAGRLRDRSD